MEPPFFDTIREAAKLREQEFVGNVSDDSDEEPSHWDIHPCSTSVFSSYQLYRIERWVKWMCEIWYLGWVPGGDMYWLEEDPVAFQAMARADGVHLAETAAVWEYAQWYLLITQCKNYDQFVLIESVDQVRFLDEIDVDMTPLDEWRKDAFLESYRSRIGQPHIHRVHQISDLDVFAIRNQRLEHHHLLVDHVGNISHTFTVLEIDLPLASGASDSWSCITGYTSRES
jgi:hypothetical protein